MTWVDCVGIFSQNINTNLQNYHQQKKPLNKWYLRVHYTCLQWKSSHLPSPQLPNPNDFKIYEPLMTSNPLPLIPSSNLVYVVARLVVKVEDVSVTKTICYVLKCTNCTNCENEFDSEFEDEGHLD